MESSKVTPRPGYIKHQRAAEVWKQELQKPQPSSRQQHLSELIKLDCVRDLWCLHSIQSESGRKTMQLWHYQNCAMVTSERCCWELLLPGWMKMEENHQKAAENNRCRRSLIPNKWYNSVITRNYAVPPSLQVLWNRGPYKYLPQGAALASPSCLFHPKQVIKIRVVDPPLLRSYTLQEVPWHRCPPLLSTGKLWDFGALVEEHQIQLSSSHFGRRKFWVL